MAANGYNLVFGYTRNRGPAIVRVAWTFTTLAIIAVGARLFGTLKLTRKLGLDDFFIVLSMASIFGLLRDHGLLCLGANADMVDYSFSDFCMQSLPRLLSLQGVETRGSSSAQEGYWKLLNGTALHSYLE